MRRRLSLLSALVFLTGTLVLAPGVFGSHAIVGPNVKVTDDNLNVDGGIGNVTPSKDAQNRQSNETTVAISHLPSPVTGVVGDLVAESANDYRMVPWFGDTWMPIYLSFDGGTTWFGAPPYPNGYNTMVPGFPTDTSPEGLASPLLGLDGAGDPVIRFDRDGNLLVGGIAFNRNRDPGERPLDTVGFVARYEYTPGSAATASTTTSAGAPPHFTYRGTAIVDRGAVGFAISPSVGFAGNFTDKPWMEVDLNSPSASPCSGNVYYADTNFHGALGGSPVMFIRSTDGGVTWSSPHQISNGGRQGASHNQGADIAVAPNGTIYVAFEAFSQQGLDTINFVKSTDCGRHWTQPLALNTINAPQAPGVAMRTPTFAFLATDTTNSNIVYAAYQSLVRRLRHLRPALDERGRVVELRSPGERRSGCAAPDLPDDRGLARDSECRLVRLPALGDAGQRGARRLLLLHELQRRELAGVRHAAARHEHLPQPRMPAVRRRNRCVPRGLHRARRPLERRKQHRPRRVGRQPRRQSM